MIAKKCLESTFLQFSRFKLVYAYLDSIVQLQNPVLSILIGRNLLVQFSSSQKKLIIRDYQGMKRQNLIIQTFLEVHLGKPQTNDEFSYHLFLCYQLRVHEKMN